jgi:hypothetical protein
LLAFGNRLRFGANFNDDRRYPMSTSSQLPPSIFPLRHCDAKSPRSPEVAWKSLGFHMHLTFVTKQIFYASKDGIAHSDTRHVQERAEVDGNNPNQKKILTG